MPDNGYLSESAMLAGAAEYQEDQVLNSPDRFSLNPETKAAAEAKVAAALKARAERTGKPLSAATPPAPIDLKNISEADFKAAYFKENGLEASIPSLSPKEISTRRKQCWKSTARHIRKTWPLWKVPRPLTRLR
jgi:hypothetical protein